VRGEDRGGKVNSVSGAAWTAEPQSEPQETSSSPASRWLDGFSVGAGLFLQFVALPLLAVTRIEEYKQALTGCDGRRTVGRMTITIPDELDEFVRAKLQAGGFESPAAVVTAALTAWQGQEVYRAMDRDGVEQLLLEAIDSPRIPWDEANFDRIIESLRVKHRAA
jgi:Arc/MetJ-type ribon-helix-helix transcriptional regulator